MRNYTLGRTGITVPQNAFGALPIQRISHEDAVKLLRKAYNGGMRFFDTARAYSDSEEKVGIAFEGMRDKVFISSKTQATTKEKFWSDLETSLKLLKTDYLDIYQLHCVARCYGEGDDLYECLKEAKKQGKIRHIGITAHKIGVAEDIINSGLYETLQFPFSYLASERDIALVNNCAKAGMAFMSEYEALPIWGIQRESELDEWLSFFGREITMTDEIRNFIENDRKELLGEFCRGCGYCMPCTVDITINQCARMSQMIRRAPSQNWLTEFWQNEMMKIENCVDCGICKTRCPYELDIPNLLKKNLQDYKEILAGKEV